jgi:hypothetical protein
MRSHLSRVESTHPDYKLLKMLGDEIARLAGGLSALEERFPLLVRDAIDFLLDPVRTARTKVWELDNVEKTFIGLKLEHFVRDMLDAPKGMRDLVILGIDVDVKNTIGNNWSIPQETYLNSEPCLLMSINDAKNTCSLGLIVAKIEYLHGGAGNRDTKRGVSTFGFENILWLVAEAPFPKSKFHGIDMDRFRQIRKIKTGNDRAYTFFKENLFRIVSRDVAQALLYDQYDFMKRLRANGGAPDRLRLEGIAIVIGTFSKDRLIANRLGVGRLKSDEIVSVFPRTMEEYFYLMTCGVIDCSVEGLSVKFD